MKNTDKVQAIKQLIEACGVTKEELFPDVWEPKVGDWVYVIYGGYGAKGANEEIGQVVEREKVDWENYNGEFRGEVAPLYIKNERIGFWGLVDGYEVRPATPEEIQKAHGNKKPILTTEDGVEVHEHKQTVYGWDEADYENIYSIEAENTLDDWDGVKWFSTEEAREQYKIQNQRLFSIADLKGKWHSDRSYVECEWLVKQLKEEAKKRIKEQ